MYDIIENQVIPKWKSYMTAKTKRRENFAKLKPRNDTLWKKMVRDMREFFRTLFRKRFDLTGIRNASDALNLMKTMFDELGLHLTKDEANDSRLYEFIHQTHEHTSKRLFRSKKHRVENTPFGIIEHYNENHLTEFMKHRLASRMLYFVFSNYLKHYVPLISKNYQNQLATLI